MRIVWKLLFGLFGWSLAKTDPLDGIALIGDECWIVDPPDEPAAYFRALIGFVLPGYIVCLEGSCDAHFWELAESRQTDNPTKVAAGTIWPKSDFCHVVATRENLEGLANAVDRLQLKVPAIHTHVYCGEVMAIEWYDAFGCDPLRISGDVSESRVKQLAEMLGTRYRRQLAPG
jgi:hypothetical protein